MESINKILASLALLCSILLLNWTIGQLKSLMLTRSNLCVHLLMADHLGFAMGLRSEWGSVAELDMTESDRNAITMKLNASDTRTKYLNRYQPFDLTTLIGH